MSHWGRIYVAEDYHVRHDGAVVTGRFSRWNATTLERGNVRYVDDNPHIMHLQANLPGGAQYVIFKDGIGQILTMTATETVSVTRVRMEPRYPLFGGWQTRFTLEYSTPLASLMRGSGSRRELSFVQAPLLQEVRRPACGPSCCPCQCRADAACHQSLSPRIPSHGSRSDPDHSGSTLRRGTGGCGCCRASMGVEAVLGLPSIAPVLRVPTIDPRAQYFPGALQTHRARGYACPARFQGLAGRGCRRQPINPSKARHHDRASGVTCQRLD